MQSISCFISYFIVIVIPWTLHVNSFSFAGKLNFGSRLRDSYLSLVSSTSASYQLPLINSSPGDFAEAFVSQKNHILLERLLDPKGNLTALAREYLNFCDESFNVFLDECVSQSQNSTDKQALGRIRYEVNMARRNRLGEADMILRDILSAGGLKQMEGKLNGYLRRGEIDMAFMVILQLNIEDAITANVVTAVQVMKHLETLINEFQDKLMSPPVQLVRLLVRENDTNVRKQMMRQKLLIGPNASAKPGQAATATPSPQCEHIIVQPVDKWGGPDVTISEFQDTINDVLSQMTGGNEDSLAEIESKCAQLRLELDEVLQEFECAGKEKCDSHKEESVVNEEVVIFANAPLVTSESDDGSFSLL
eukprot:gene2212-4300_t